MLPDTEICFVPVKDVPARLKKGWRMVPGYAPSAHDYAVLMVPARSALYQRMGG